MPLMTSTADFRFPGPKDRTAIYGRTGQGKTVLGAHILSQQNFDRMPWIMLDFKRDDLLTSIRHVEKLSITDKIPKHPGLYLVHPAPEDDRLEDFLWRVHAKRNTGLSIDEGFMVPKNSRAFQTLLTQGRSLRLPIINLTQRPVYLSRFVTTQADYHALFPFSDDRDNDIALQFMPKAIKEFIGDHHDDPLPKYHSFWYDVGANKWCVLSAAPSPDEIREYFETRLKPKRRTL